MTDYERQQIIDIEHLRLLRIAYFVDCGMTAFMGLVGLLYMGMGVMLGAIMAGIPRDANAPPPAFFELFFGIIGGAIFIFAGALVVMKLLTAKALKARRSRTLCLVTAALTCLYIPYGTIIGIFTFIVLERPSVKALFDGQPPSWQPPVPPAN